METAKIKENVTEDLGHKPVEDKTDEPVTRELMEEINREYQEEVDKMTFFQKIKEAFKTFRYKDPQMKYGKDQMQMKWNIYAKQGTIIGDYCKISNIINFGMKYRIVVPLMKLFELFYGKYLIKQIPPEPYNKNIKIFDDAMISAVDKWLRHYTCARTRNGKLVPDGRLRDMRRGMSVRLLNNMRWVVNTIALYDTAYRELINFFVLEIANKTIETYKDSDKIEHIMYKGNDAWDVSYKVAYDILSKSQNMQVEINKLEKLKKEIDETRKDLEKENPDIPE